MRFFASAAVALLLIAAAGIPATAADSNVFFKATIGGSYPFMKNLNDELMNQGRCSLTAGAGFGLSLGRSFAKHKWGLELWFDYARYQSFKYQNAYEDFQGEMSHYNFMLVGKRNLWPSNPNFRPYIGAGFGYGYTNIARDGGRIDGLAGMLLLQFESRIKDNIAMFIEGTYLSNLSRDKYDTSFLNSADYPAILDSNGDPLDERFSAIGLRIGIQAWLKPPAKYGEYRK